MARETFTISSDLPVHEAFERCLDLTRVSEWDRGIKESRLVGGSGDSVGSTYEISVTGFDGEPATAVYELLEVDAPHRFVMEGLHPTFRAHDTLTFAATDTGSELTYDAVLELLGDDPPMTPEQLDTLFARVAAVPEAGLRAYLVP